MKRFVKHLFVAAGVVLALASCRKDFELMPWVPEDQALLTISTGTPESRTAISGTTPSWKSGDKVTVVYTNTSSEVVTAQSSALASDASEASFSVLLTSPNTSVEAHA